MKGVKISMLSAHVKDANWCYVSASASIHSLDIKHPLYHSGVKAFEVAEARTMTL